MIALQLPAAKSMGLRWLRLCAFDVADALLQAVEILSAAPETLGFHDGLTVLRVVVQILIVHRSALSNLGNRLIDEKTFVLLVGWDMF